MILKNFINFFNLFIFLGLFILIFIFAQFLINSKIREKFFLFILLFFFISSIGLYYNLDGMVMMFAVCELGVILIFIVTYSQLYCYDKKTTFNKKNFIIIYLFIFLLNFDFYSCKIVNFKNFYSIYSININDFYYIYNCYFEKQILSTTIISLLLTLYSLFFIHSFIYLVFIIYKSYESLGFITK